MTMKKFRCIVGSSSDFAAELTELYGAEEAMKIMDACDD